MTDSTLRVENLTMHYSTRAGDVRAVENVSFTVKPGESLGLVGESGCGKTSVALTLLRLMPDNAKVKTGEIWLGDTEILGLSKEDMRHMRWSRIAMVFQAAMNALNPVYKVGDQIIEAINEHIELMTRDQARERVKELFAMVGLDANWIDRYPHEFSGGMRQRAVIALALSCNPDLIIADEPTTALDVIVQDHVLRTLEHVQEMLGMSMIYISHDIAVIAEVCKRIGVMYAGQMVEMAEATDIFEHPRHPYTAALINSFPSIKGKRHKLEPLGGEPPDLVHPPSGCRFHPRCPYATEQCVNQTPEFKDYGNEHFAACWHPLEK